MKSVGHLLKEARESTNQSVADVAKHTKIREEYLQSIEENLFEQLPEGPFVRGFLRTYALEVGLNPESIVAIYRRDFGSREKQRLIPKGVVNPLQRKSNMLLSPVVFAVFVLVCVASLYVTYQWTVLTQPPPIVVDAPKENQELRSPIDVQGTTSTDALVLVNSIPTAVDQNGRFITQLELEPGEQTITIEAKSRQDKTRSVRKTIRVVE